MKSQIFPVFHTAIQHNLEGESRILSEVAWGFFFQATLQLEPEKIYGAFAPELQRSWA